MKNALIKSLPFVVLFVVAALPMFAQSVNPKDVPIDGGISALLIGGAAYGAKKLHKRKNEQ